MNFRKLTAVGTLFLSAACGTGVSDQPPPPLDEVRPYYSADMQSGLTGYYNTHSLDKAKAPAAGLTIPWVASNERSKHSVWGFLVATGETSDRGCPVFNSATVSFRGAYSSVERDNLTLAMCPQ